MYEYILATVRVRILHRTRNKKAQNKAQGHTARDKDGYIGCYPSLCQMLAIAILRGP